MNVAFFKIEYVFDMLNKSTVYALESDRMTCTWSLTVQWAWITTTSLPQLSYMCKTAAALSCGLWQAGIKSLCCGKL